jgi:hypothetical protein
VTVAAGLSLGGSNRLLQFFGETIDVHILIIGPGMDGPARVLLNPSRRVSL